MRRIIATTAAAAIVLAACGGDGEPEATGRAAERPSSTAKIEIVQPAPGETFAGDDVPVELRLEGGRIVDEVSTDLTPTDGHVHLSLDGEVVTLLGSLNENLAELAGGTIEPGQHVLEAEFVAKDHGFFIPRVLQTVTFVVA